MKNTKQMNVVLWVLQVLLALYTIPGAIYMIMNYQDLASTWAIDTLPQPIWMALGILQILFAIGLVLPSRKDAPQLVSISAAVLAVLSLLGYVLYIAYAGFPGMLWALIPAVLFAFVAYGRWPAKS